MSKAEKIVVTGASGFLGSHLISRLRDAGEYTVYALSSRPEELKVRIGGSNVEFLIKDAIKGNQANEILSEAVVVNCAYPRNAVGTAVADGLKYIQRVFTQAVKHGASAIINISSQSVYSSQRTRPASEDTALCLESPYAVGKYATELMLEVACKNSSTAYTNIRMASLIGPGFEQRIVNRLIRAAAENGRLQADDSRQRFGFLDVEDAVTGLKCLLSSDPRAWEPVYNLGNNRAYTLKEISSAILLEFEAENMGRPTLLLEKKDSEGSSEIDACLFMTSFHFTPEVSLEDSIRRIMKKMYDSTAWKDKCKPGEAKTNTIPSCDS